MIKLDPCAIDKVEPPDEENPRNLNSEFKYEILFVSFIMIDSRKYFNHGKYNSRITIMELIKNILTIRFNKKSKFLVLEESKG